MAKSAAQIGTMAGMVVGSAAAIFFSWGAATPAVLAAIGTYGAIGATVGGVAGALYDTSTADDQVRDQQGIADLAIQNSTYGSVIPQIFGGYGGVAGNVIWATNKIPHEHRTEQRASAKGGGPKVVTVTRTYTQSMAIGICDTRITGPVSFLRIIYRDLTPFHYGAPGKAMPDGWTFYSGAVEQMPDPTIEAQKGVGNVPAFRHLCYVVVKDDDLGMSGRTFNYTFDVATDEQTSLNFGAMRVQPETGRPWVNIRQANEIQRFDPETQAVLGRTPYSGPELLGGFSGTLTSQLAVSAARGWASADGWLYELDGASGAILSSWEADIHPLASILFRDHFASPLVERGEAVLGLVRCAASYAEFGSRTDTEIVRMQRGGVISRRTITARNPFDLAPAPDGTVWAVMREGQLPPLNEALTWHPRWYMHHLDPVSLGTISLTDVGVEGLGVMHVDPQGRVWLPVAETNMLRRYGADGQLQAEMSLAHFPIQCTTASDGRLWCLTTDLGAAGGIPTEPGHLYQIDPDAMTVVMEVRVDATTFAALTHTFGVEAADPQLIAGGEGSVWCTSRIQKTVSHVSALGRIDTFRTAGTPITVQASTTAGEVWVSCLESGVQRFTASGPVPVPAFSSSPGGLAGVLTQLCGAAGLGPDRLDLADLPGGRVQMALVSMQAVRAPLQDLAQAYRFYVVESGTRLAFRQIGSGPVVADLGETNLDAAENVSPGNGLVIQRLDEQQLPTELDFTSSDPAQRYQANTQRHMLGLTTGAQEAPRTVSLALALAAQDAKQVSQEMLTQLWVQREIFRSQTSRTFAYLEPGDRVSVTARGLQYQVVLMQTNYGRPGLLEFQAMPDAAYVRGAVGAPAPPIEVAPPTLPVLQPTTAVLLNLPALHGADVTPRAHVAFIGGGPGWDGAALYRSRDGETYEVLLSSSLEAWSGIVTQPTPAADWHVLDTTTVIRVVMRGAQMQLTSVSDDALFGGANRVVLGNEILAYGLATLVGAQTYDLSRLLRGLRGTEHLVDHGLSNERLFVLDQAILPFAVLPGDVGSPRFYKAVSVGQTIDLVEPQTFTATAANMFPWDVAAPRAVRQPNDDWLLTWRMRSRFAPGWVQRAGPVPFDVDFRNFRVDIFSGGTFATMLRSTPTDGGNPMDGEALKTWTYPVAQQTADFGAAQTTLAARVYQVTNTGVGYAIDLNA